MKINWGTGLAIGMTLFIGFIMYMVTSMLTDSKYDHDLVTEDYYRKEMELQDNIDAATNAKNTRQDINLRKTEQGLFVFLETQEQYLSRDGRIEFYRPSDEQLDFAMEFKDGEKQLFVPDHKLLTGQYRLTVKYTYEGESYLLKKHFTY